jgi:hypothetical protein
MEKPLIIEAKAGSYPFLFLSRNIHEKVVLTTNMSRNTIAPKPEINMSLLLKSNLSRGKGWKNRINKKMPILMLIKSFRFSLKDLLH